MYKYTAINPFTEEVIMSDSFKALYQHVRYSIRWSLHNVSPVPEYWTFHRGEWPDHYDPNPLYNSDELRKRMEVAQ